MTQRLLTPSDVAERLALTKQYVYELIRTGEIKSIRISPKAIRVSEEALAEFLLERTR